jgi:hypothetical protein
MCIPADTQIGSSITWDTVPFSDSYNYSGQGNYSWTATILAPPSSNDPCPVQIAVWRNYEVRNNKVNGSYTAGTDNSLSIKSADTGVRMGDYVCVKEHGEWRHIIAVNNSGTTLTMSEPFSVSPIRTDSGVYIADNKNLISVYSTTIPGKTP